MVEAIIITLRVEVGEFVTPETWPDVKRLLAPLSDQSTRVEVLGVRED